MTWILAVLSVGLSQATAPQPEPFREQERKYGILNGTGRTIPNPEWINLPWRKGADIAFQAIQDEVDAALATTKAFDRSGKWPKKFWKAANEYFADYQSPIKLFNASSCYGVAAVLDPNFAGSKDANLAIQKINRGWEYLRKPPPSYLFIRRGYIVNAGDEDRHDYADLAQRLLKRKPDDRSVAFCMSLEYFTRDDGPFVSLLFKTLESLCGGSQWRAWDGFRYGKTLELRYLRHKDRRDHERAITLVEESLKATPSGVDAAWMKDYLSKLKSSD